MKRWITILFAAILLSLSSVIEAQPKFVCDTIDMYDIYYRQNSAKIDPDFRDNASTISIMKQELSEIQSISGDAVQSVVINGYASPEGTEHYNYRLSLRRAREMSELISSIPGMEDVVIELRAHGEDSEGFIERVEKHYHGENCDLLLKILNSDVPTHLKIRWIRLMDEDGTTWEQLLRDFMNDSRRSTAQLHIRTGRLLDELPDLPALISRASADSKEDFGSEESVQTIYAYDDISARPRRSRYIPSARIPKAALRTNLLVPALNVGLEIPAGNRWSFAADYYYPWFWPDEKNKDCFEFLGLSLESRLWFGRDRRPQERLMGHSLGFYVAGGYYDFEKDYRGMQGEFLSPGLDYTYSVAVGRKKRVNFSFTFALGYIRSWGRSYKVYDEYGELYPDEGTVIWNYVGPTKVAVTLSVPLYGKEGRR